MVLEIVFDDLDFEQHHQYLRLVFVDFVTVYTVTLAVTTVFLDESV